VRVVLCVFFYFLSICNKFFLPSLSGKKMQDFNKIQFAILGFKYWVTKNYLIYRK
jgi:hypothetical protein